jgi:hypothetical protein
MGVLRSNRHYAVDDATVLQDTISLADTQMPEVGWIDALRRYNLGGTSWCIPRRGTAEYEKVMMIRKGAEDVKPQPRRRTIKARIKEEKPEPEPESHAEIPMVAEKETPIDLSPMKAFEDQYSANPNAKPPKRRVSEEVRKQKTEEYLTRLRKLASRGVLWKEHKGGYSPKSAGGNIYYYVQQGDNLIKIASTYVETQEQHIKLPLRDRIVFQDFRAKTLPISEAR